MEAHISQKEEILHRGMCGLSTCDRSCLKASLAGYGWLNPEVHHRRWILLVFSVIQEIKLAYHKYGGMNDNYLQRLIKVIVWWKCLEETIRCALGGRGVSMMVGFEVAI